MADPGFPHGEGAKPMDGRLTMIGTIVPKMHENGPRDISTITAPP